MEESTIWSWRQHVELEAKMMAEQTARLADQQKMTGMFQYM
jgi:hypothetical protein